MHKFNNQLSPEDLVTIDGAPIFPRNKDILKWFLRGTPISRNQANAIKNDPECVAVMQSILGDRYPVASAILNQKSQTMKFIKARASEFALVIFAMLMVICLAAFLVNIITSKSQQKPPQTTPKPTLQEKIYLQLPSAAENLKDRGNNWFSFEMFSGENKKKFLVRVQERGSDVVISNVTLAE